MAESKYESQSRSFTREGSLSRSLYVVPGISTSHERNQILGSKPPDLRVQPLDLRVQLLDLRVQPLDLRVATACHASLGCAMGFQEGEADDGAEICASGRRMDI